MKYAVRMYYNEPIWFSGKQEQLFNTEKEAIQAIEDEAKECEKAFKKGYMDSVGDFECYRVIEVTA